MKIIIAPNAMKGSLSAEDAANAIEKGIWRVLPSSQRTKIPIADGGDGLFSVLSKKMLVVEKTCLVKNPVGQFVNATYLYSDATKSAIIEMASAAGLALLKPSEYDPLNANTFGVGELICSALDEGAKQIILGIGGSATNDAGTGLANALGFRFLDSNFDEVPPGGGNLSKIEHIDTENVDRRLDKIKFKIACDVTNPLLGEEGSARVYASQKGATEKQIVYLERGFESFSKILEHYSKKSSHLEKGAGAAGGLGVGMMALFNAKLISGAELVLDILEFEKQAVGADLIITAEGKLDFQTQFGKAPYFLAQRAKKMKIPCVIVAGQIEGNHSQYFSMGFSGVFSLCTEKISSEQAMTDASNLLTHVVERCIIQLQECQ